MKINNNKIINANTIIFDYDGTLYNSSIGYIKSFRKICDILIDDSIKIPKQYSDNEIIKWLGVTPKDMWAEFMPQLSEKDRKNYSVKLGELIARSISNGDGALYDGVTETLQYLKAKNKVLVLLSNCTNKYMTMHKNKFSLNKYFDLFCCSEDFGYMSKSEIFSGYIENPNENYIVVGDRYKDIEISENKKNVFAIGCGYGFGNISELEKSDIIIENISELCDIL